MSTILGERIVSRSSSFRSRIARLHHDECGQSMALMLVTIGLALLMGVIVVDVGLIYGERRQAQTAADFAALAAAQDLPRHIADPDLSLKLATAEATALDYLRRNGYDPAAPDVTAAARTSYVGDVDKIEVTVSRPRQWLLGRLFGLREIEISGRAVAAANGVPRDVMVVLDNSGSMCLFSHGGPMSTCLFPVAEDSGNGAADNPLEENIPSNSGDLVVVAATAGMNGSYSANNGFAIETDQTSGATMTFATASKSSAGGGETISMEHSNPNRQVLGAITLANNGTPVALAGSWSTGLSHTAPAGSDRYLVFMTGWEDSGGSDVSSLTYGGQALQRLQKERVGNGPRGGVEIWVLDNAGIAAAADDTFVVNWDETVTNVLYAHAFFENVNQAGNTSYEPFDTVAAAAVSFGDNFKPFVEGVPFDQLGVVSYNWDAQLELGLTTDYLGAGNAYESAVNAIVPEGRTNIGHAIWLARTTLENTGTPGSQKIIVLLSDGIANVYLDINSTNENPIWINGGAGDEAEDYAREEATLAAQVGMSIYTIGLTENAGEQLLRDIADIGNSIGAGGQFFDVDDPAGLGDTFEQIAELINYALVE